MSAPKGNTKPTTKDAINAIGHQIQKLYGYPMEILYNDCEFTESGIIKAQVKNGSIEFNK